MSNDMTTLADVKPGGRVRLGDQLPPLPKAGYVTGGDFGHEAHNAFTPEQMREYALAALSALPSPGGQGDARALIQRYDAAGAKFRESLMDDHYSDAQRVELRRELTAAQDELLTALAARQPVGQEPVAYMVRWKTEGGFGLEWPKNMQYFRDRADEYEIVPLQLAAPPAQAVDLGAVRALLQRRIEQWRSHLPTDPGAPGTREIETKGEHDYNNDVRIYREGIAVMEEVMSKIDSQAVGNG